MGIVFRRCHQYGSAFGVHCLWKTCFHVQQKCSARAHPCASECSLLQEISET